MTKVLAESVFDIRPSPAPDGRDSCSDGWVRRSMTKKAELEVSPADVEDDELEAVVLLLVRLCARELRLVDITTKLAGETRQQKIERDNLISRDTENPQEMVLRLSQRI